eukprot:gene2748-1996_t
MDVVSAVVSIAQGVRLVIEAVKDEKKLAKSAQQLSHSCQMYIECLNSIVTAMNNHILGGKKPSSEMQRFLENISTQVKLDQPLLEEILAECESIRNSKSSYSLMQNLMMSVLNKRVESLKVLENKLALRTQILTSLMLQDVWRTTNGLDEEFIEFVGDLEAASFWNRHFGTTKQISLRSFVEAYQKYICDTYNYRLLGQMQMLTLLRYTILEDAQGGSSNAVLLNTEISLASSDPRNHFVISVKSPVTQNIEHFALANSAMGYSLAGEAQIFSLTLADCVQNYIFDKLFATATGQRLELLRDASEAWDSVFLSAVESRIYEDSASFKSTVQNLPPPAVGKEGSGAFGSLFANSTPVPAAAAEAAAGSSQRLVAATAKSAGEQKVIGFYMVEQGLQLLLQAGELNPVEVDRIRNIVFRG